VSTYSSKTSEIVDALIIDDEEDICYLLNGILKQRKLSAQYVNTLSEAKTVMKSDGPAILFLDNHLPDGFGIDFMPYIKKEYPFAKVVMITAHDSQQDRKNAYEMGVDYFLSKPFTRAQVNEVMDKMERA
jgi:two-component system OmpR family response regulator